MLALLNWTMAVRYRDDREMMDLTDEHVMRRMWQAQELVAQARQRFIEARDARGVAKADGVRLLYHKFFVEVRQGKLMKGLFSALARAKSQTFSSIVEQYIWACWSAHEDRGVWQMMEQGQRLMKEKRFGEAAAVYNRVVHQDPRFAEGWNRRATCHFYLGALDRALADVRAALACEPLHFGCWSGLGLIKMRQRAFADAVDSFQRAAGIHPWMIKTSLGPNLARCRHEADKQTQRAQGGEPPPSLPLPSEQEHPPPHDDHPADRIDGPPDAQPLPGLSAAAPVTTPAPTDGAARGHDLSDIPATVVSGADPAPT